MQRFEFYDDFVVEITGSGPLYNYFEMYYDEFTSDTTRENVDLICNFSNNNIEPDQMLGGGRKWFGRTDDVFIITFDGCQIRISPDWQWFSVHNDFPVTKFRTLVEGELRQHLAQSEMVMLHGSGVKYDGDAMIFPAWRHTGKTNTMLSFLIEGASYFADDRLFVTRDTVWGFPVPINILHYNLSTFPELLDERRIDAIRNALHRQILSLSSRSTSDAAKAIQIASNNLVRSTRQASLSDIGIEPPPAFEAQSQVDMVGMLQTVCGEPDVTFTELDRERFLDSMATISYTEWDSLLQEIYMAFDQLFPDAEQKRAQLEWLHDVEKTVLADLHENTERTTIVGIPREYDWPTDVTSRIVE